MPTTGYAALPLINAVNTAGYVAPHPATAAAAPTVRHTAPPFVPQALAPGPGNPALPLAPTAGYRAPLAWHQQQYGVPRSSNYSKEVTTVAKIYIDNEKYDSIGNSFDFKLTIFRDICQRSGLPAEGYMTAFPTMLKGLAQQHYYNSALSTKTFDAACAHIRNFFEGQEYY